MKANEPLVSVIVPSFNQGRYIERTLLSILGQDYQNLEVIVVDGASQDETMDVLEKYEGRIVIVSEPDTGQSNAINKGFRMARGEFVSWLNSDDIYVFPSAVSNVVSSFMRHPDIDIMFGDYVRIDESDTLLKIYHTWKQFNPLRLVRTCYVSQPTVFFRANVVKQNQIDESLHYGMDLDFWLALGRRGYRFMHSGTIIAGERIHSLAKTVKGLERSREESFLVAQRYTAPSQHGEILLTNMWDKLWMAYFRAKAIWTLIRFYLPLKTVIPIRRIRLATAIAKQFVRS